MRLLIIDDQGELWGESSSVIRTSFASSYADDGFSAYLVKNLGFAALDIYGRSCQVRVRPAITTQATFETLIGWVASNDYQRVALSHFDGDWNLELHASPDLLSHRLMQLINTKQLTRPTDFIAQESSVDTLASYPALKSLVENWDMLTANIDASGLQRILRQLTQGRYTLLRYEDATDQLLIEDTGAGYTTYGKDWPKLARGAPFENQPDPDYGHWLRDTFAEAISSADPLVHNVDAIVSTPTFGRYRLRYKRLILPFHAKGNTWLLASSAMEDRIDLRQIEGLERAG
ncbi:MAG: hypothetical protein AAFQ45_10895 [Pseudomonadota bacterium]